MYSKIIALAAALSATVLAAPAVEKRQTTANSYIQFGSHCNRNVEFEVFENMGNGVAGGKLTSGTLYNQQGFMSQEINYGEQNLGVVIKTSFNQNPSESGDVLQFEVAKDNNRNIINYDISAVNGDPFKAQGSAMSVNDGSCYSIRCPPGDDSCAFQYPEDNSKDHECAGTNHIVYASVC